MMQAVEVQVQCMADGGDIRIEYPFPFDHQRAAPRDYSMWNMLCLPVYLGECAKAFLNFEDRRCCVWINGSYGIARFHMTSEFDITGLLQRREERHNMAVLSWWCDGSHLEDRDRIPVCQDLNEHGNP